MSQWYYKLNDQVRGPISLEDLEYLVSSGKVVASIPVRSGKQGDWGPFAGNKLLSERAPSQLQRKRLHTPEKTKHVPTTTPCVPPPVVPPKVPRRHTGGPASRHRTILAVAAAFGSVLLLLIILLLVNTPKSPSSGLADADRGSGVDPADQAPSQSTNDKTEFSESESAEPQSSEATGGGVARSAGNQPLPEGLSVEDVSEAEGITRRETRFSVAPVFEARFFGLRAEGKRFVFAVDASGSMYPDRLERAKRELVSSLTALADGLEYHVVFFGDTPHPMPRMNGTPFATTANVDQTRLWIERIGILGGTNVRDALSHAVLLKPDAIFLLTDGEFDPDTPAFARQINGAKIPIHTIAFVSREGESQLRQIADDSNGDYRFVP